MRKAEGRVHSLLLLLPVLLLAFAFAGCGDNNEAVTETVPGKFVADASAGDGTTGLGGGGGEGSGILIASNGLFGTTVANTGVANAAFAIPAAQAVAKTKTLGANALVVTDNTKIVPYVNTDNRTAALDNTFYLGTYKGVSTLWKQIDNTPVRVTGIEVQEGKTLILEANVDTNFNQTRETVQIILKNDFYNLGTVQTVALDCSVIHDGNNTLSRAAFLLGAYGQIYNGPKAKINTAGSAAAALSNKLGGVGGGIYLDSFSRSSANGGFILNQGIIDASGGTGDNNAGSPAAQLANSCYFFDDPALSGRVPGEGTDFGFCEASRAVYIWTHGYIINTGRVLANGGDGAGNSGGSAADLIELDATGWVYNLPSTAGDNNIQGVGGKGVGSGTTGGHGSAIYLWSDGGVYNAGGILADGGSGGQNGGSAGRIDFDSLVVRNSGRLSANGGSATGLATAPNYGQHGGRINLWSAKEFINSGDITANGGAANDNASSQAGGGGEISLELDPWVISEQALNLVVSGNLSAKGGKGGRGGYGGHIGVFYGPVGRHNDSSNPNYSTGGIYLYGYTNLKADGGNGKTGGGSGGGVLVSSASDAWFRGEFGGGFNDGPVSQQIIIGEGGMAGGVRMPPGVVLNQAAISAKGGNGDNNTANSTGGYGGFALVATDPNASIANTAQSLGFNWPNALATNQGAVTLDGGYGSKDAGSGGAFLTFGYLQATNTGKFSAIGGNNFVDNTLDRTGNGGYAAIVSQNGTVSWAADMNANGGKGIKYAGSGGGIDAFSLSGTTVSGAFDLRGGDAALSAKGTGARAGDGGYVWLFSASQNSVWGGSAKVTKGSGGDPDFSAPAIDGGVSVDGITR